MLLWLGLNILSQILISKDWISDSLANTFMMIEMKKTLNGMQNDVFYGMRIAFNDISDTSFLAGAIYDMDTATQLYSVEGSRRFANSVVVTLEGRIFSGVSDKERFLSYFKQDSFFSISLSKYF